MQKASGNTVSRLSWMWALLPLLLAAALVAPILGKDVFDVDEAATMLNAGARHLGPFTPAEAVQTSVSRSPDQAWGHVVVFSQWGRIAGWSELAMRTLPWLTGFLTLAWVYRIGRALFSQRISLTAMLLLSTSVVFLSYMHKSRPYGFSMLFAAIVLWAYWRVALSPRSPGYIAWALLVLGATGLLYAHYFGALLLPALALFHLFFVRKERRWWQPVVLLGLAALLALPQVPDLLSGIAANLDKDSLHAEALRYPEVSATFLRYLSNGLLEIRRPFSTLFAFALPLPLVLLWLAQLAPVASHPERPGTFRSPASCSCCFCWAPMNGCACSKRNVFAIWRRCGHPSCCSSATLSCNPCKRQPAPGSRACTGHSGGPRRSETTFCSRGNWSASQGSGVRRPSPSLPRARSLRKGATVACWRWTESGLFARFHRVYEFYTGSYGDRRVKLDQPAASNELLERAQGA